jgi:hypothetical protein
MAEGIFFLAAMILLLPPHLCNSLLLQPPHYHHHHHRPIQTQIFSVDPITATTDRDDSLPSQQSIKRKRRRRKADSFFLTQSTDEESSSTLIESSTNYSLKEEIVAEKQQSECPFVMTFPRYRVNINSYNKAESEKRRSRRVQRGVIKKLVNNLSAKQRKNVDEDNGKNNEGVKPWGIVSNIVQGVFSDTVDTKSNIISRNSDRVRNSVESIYETEVNEGLFRWSSSAEIMAQASTLADEDFIPQLHFGEWSQILLKNFLRNHHRGRRGAWLYQKQQLKLHQTSVRY